MVTARELRAGQCLRLGGDLFRVLGVRVHAPTAQQGGVVHATVRNVFTGHETDLRWSSGERLEAAPVEHRDLQYLYADRSDVVLMNPETFEQYTFPRLHVEHALPYLKDGARVRGWLYEGQVIDLELPVQVAMTVVASGAGVHDGHGSGTMKEATLENGLTILVPQFVQRGDVIEVEVATGSYLERVRR